MGRLSGSANGGMAGVLRCTRIFLRRSAQSRCANWRVKQARREAMQQAGIDTEFHVYSGLGHGFGLGTGTSAEGWINDAVDFWEQQMKK